MREILTPEQVAEYLQLNTDTVYRLIRDKRLAASRIGRTYRIPRQDLEQFLATNSTRNEVREALFRRALNIARKHPELDADELLAELEEDEVETRPEPT